MVKKIYLINGINGAGKDEFVKMYAGDSKYKVINISSVQPFKSVFEEAKLPHRDDFSRKAISKMKDFMDTYLNYTIRYVEVKINNYREKDGDYVLFFHIREEDIIGMLRMMFDLETILVKNFAVLPNTEKDTLIGKGINYNYVIENSIYSETLEDAAYILSTKDNSNADL